MKTRRASWALVACATAAATLLACDDGTAPAGPPAAISVVSGNDQQAVVATTLAQPIAVKVLDAQDRPVPGVLVTFHVTSGGGSVALGAADTDGDGVAREFWTLGTSTSAAQALEARVSGGATLLSTTVTATAQPAPPASITVVSGSGQSATVASALGAPLVARVDDHHGNPVPGVVVTFAVATGSMAGAAATTSANGLATSGTWTLGTVAGTQSATASAPGVSGTAGFTATANASAATKLLIASAVQSAIASGTRFFPEIVVRAYDQHNNATTHEGAVVMASLSSGNAVLAGQTQVTLAAGSAVFPTLEVWGQVGTVTVQFSATGLIPTTTGSVTVTPGIPAQLHKVSGDAQSDTTNAHLNPPVVRMTDASGNPLGGVTIIFEVVTQGIVAGGTQVTNADGLASPTSWRAGASPGTHTLRARQDNSAGVQPVTFSATITTP